MLLIALSYRWMPQTVKVLTGGYTHGALRSNGQGIGAETVDGNFDKPLPPELVPQQAGCSSRRRACDRYMHVALRLDIGLNLHMHSCRRRP